MNGAVGLVGRSELRRRWVGLVGVVLLAVLVSAAVLAGVTGARRTASTLDRFRSWSNAGDAQFQTSDPAQIQPLVAMLRADPSVETVATRYLVNAFPEDGSLPDFALTTDPDGTLGTSIDRRRVIEGRMPDADALGRGPVERVGGPAHGDGARRSDRGEDLLADRHRDHRRA